MAFIRRALKLPAYATAAVIPPTYAWYVSSSGDYWLEGAWRGIYFWARVGPIVLHYKWVDWKTSGVDAAERGRAFEHLHSKYAPVALDVMLALRGFYIKVGQFASARADITPTQYMEQFRTLQDQVPYQDLEYIRQTITTSLGRPAEDIFAHIERQPLGSASIGQVHYAKLHDGSEVVVKVQYPSVRRTFYLDMSCIRSVLCIAEPSLAPVLEELRKQFLTEFDYRGEARNLTDVSSCLLPKWEGCIALPQPLLDLCGEHVLTMTYLAGEKLETSLQREWRRLGLTPEKLNMRLQSSTPPGPWRLAFYLRALGWYCSVLHAWETAKYSLCALPRLICGTAVRKPKDESVQLVPQRNHILNILLSVHAQQVLIDGVFNADLHPGNFLLLPDGRLGLIDFGQVKRINPETRRKLARLLVALARGDKCGTVSAFTDLGVRSKQMDPRFLEANARFLFGRVDGELTGGRPLIEFLKDLKTWDTLVEIPGELYLPARAASMLRGLAMLLHCNVSIAEEWRAVAEQVLAETSAP